MVATPRNLYKSIRDMCVCMGKFSQKVEETGSRTKGWKNTSVWILYVWIVNFKRSSPFLLKFLYHLFPSVWLHLYICSIEILRGFLGLFGKYEVLKEKIKRKILVCLNISTSSSVTVLLFSKTHLSSSHKSLVTQSLCKYKPTTQFLVHCCSESDVGESLLSLFRGNWKFFLSNFRKLNF